MSRFVTLLVLAMLVIPAGLPLVATAQTPQAAGLAHVEAEAPTDYPLTITNCGVDLTFDAPPQGAATLATNTTEIMLALGLADHLAGMVGPKDDILPELQDAVSDVFQIAERAFPYPSREVVLAANPNLLISGYGGDFTEGAYGTRESYQELGILTFYLSDACEDAGSITLETTFEDIKTIGRIFNVPEAAAELINQMIDEAGVADFTGDPVSVFVFAGDTVEETITVGGGNLLDDMINRAGGTNIFADVAGGGHNVEANMEEIVARNPEVILIIRYRALDPADIIAYMKSDPSWSQVAAVQQDRFVVIGVTETVPSIRNGRALHLLSEGFATGA